MKNAPKLPRHHDYEVGYGKPPATTRFQKGKSGNPNGRPKGARNKFPKEMQRLRNMVINEAQRVITIQDKSGPIAMPIAQAAFRSLALKAAQGNVTAQKLFLQSVSHAENEEEKERTEIFINAIEYKERMQNEIQIAYAQDRDIEKEILPHPDHVVIDTRAGKVKILGPIDEEDQKLWNVTWQQKADYEHELQECIKDLEKPELNQDSVMRGILHCEYILTLIELTIIKRWDRPIEEVVEDCLRRSKIIDLIENDELPERPDFKVEAIQ